MTRAADDARRLEAEEAAHRRFGIGGRMISQSKSWYQRRYPKHLVIFNAHLCLKNEGRIWSGDIDVDTDSAELVALAAELGETVYVLHEFDGIRKNRDHPLIEHAIAHIHPDGTIERRLRGLHAWDGDGRRLI